MHNPRMAQTSTPLAALKQSVDAFGTQKAAARHYRISQAYMNDLVHGRRDIPAWLLKRLGFKSVTVPVSA